MRPDGGDQGWLNSIYLWEMFDIGHEYNLMAITEQTLGHHKFMENATILHYAGGFVENKIYYYIIIIIIIIIIFIFIFIFNSIFKLTINRFLL